MLPRYRKIQNGTDSLIVQASVAFQSRVYIEKLFGRPLRGMLLCSPSFYSEQQAKDYPLSPVAYQMSRGEKV